MCNDPSIQLQRTEKKHFEPKNSSNWKSSLKKKLLDILKMQLSIKTHQVDPFDTLDDDDDFQIVYFFHRIQTSLLVQYGLMYYYPQPTCYYLNTKPP